MKKGCYNCYFYKYPTDKEPCRDCHKGDSWMNMRIRTFSIAWFIYLILMVGAIILVAYSIPIISIIPF